MKVKLPLVDLSSAKKGDLIIRSLGGAPMNLIIAKVQDGIITAIPPIEDGNPFASMVTEDEGWTFDQKTGMEIDDRFGWGPSTGVTGSYITRLIQ